MPSKYSFSDSSPDWPARFEEEARALRTLLGEELVAIHHIGSTSVPGLAAKPMIDLLPLARSIVQIDLETPRLQSAGYKAWGEYGLPGRRYFTKEDEDGIRTHNIHIYQFDDPDVERHLAFCAYLRHDAAARREYEALKRDAYARHPADLEAYRSFKDAWIKTTERIALEWYRTRRAGESKASAHESEGSAGIAPIRGDEVELSMPEANKPFDLESFWEYSDPAASEGRFRAVLPTAHGDEALELRTQIARTYSLRRRFAEAHDMLNEVERELHHAGVRPRVRYLLERGRAFNSAGENEKARDFFLKAWELAHTSSHVGLAVDAAHMVAITFSGTADALRWNEKGLALAVPSRDSKARALIPAMLNNSAWDLHGMERFDEALIYFQRAEQEWTARGKPQQIRIAKWSVARCLRSLGRHREALETQRHLEAEHIAEGTTDGYVFEEIAENLWSLGEQQEARTYFAKAVDELGKDDWFVKNEAKRFESLVERARES